MLNYIDLYNALHLGEIENTIKQIIRISPKSENTHTYSTGLNH